jgi:hypothetical protein
MGQSGQKKVPRGEVVMTNQMFATLTERLKNQATKEALARASRIIDSAPCEVARIGEFTYECAVHRPCRICTWRQEAQRSLKEKP